MTRPSGPGRGRPMSPFLAVFLVLVLGATSYAAGRLHGQLSYRIGYRFGYRQGYFDGDRGAWNRRRRDAQAAIASALSVSSAGAVRSAGTVGPPRHHLHRLLVHRAGRPDRRAAPDRHARSTDRLSRPAGRRERSRQPVPRTRCVVRGGHAPSGPRQTGDGGPAGRDARRGHASRPARRVPAAGPSCPTVFTRPFPEIHVAPSRDGPPPLASRHGTGFSRASRPARICDLAHGVPHPTPCPRAPDEAEHGWPGAHPSEQACDDSPYHRRCRPDPGRDCHAPPRPPEPPYGGRRVGRHQGAATSGPGVRPGHLRAAVRPGGVPPVRRARGGAAAGGHLRVGGQAAPSGAGLVRPAVAADARRAADPARPAGPCRCPPTTPAARCGWS